MTQRPPFDKLPLREGDPPFSAWGLYGDKDQLGALNLLTPENTLAAAKNEIRTGIRVSLDPPINSLLEPSHGRTPLKQKIFRRGNRPVHDDVLEFNTQVRTAVFLPWHLFHFSAGSVLNFNCAAILCPMLIVLVILDWTPMGRLPASDIS